MLDKVTGLTAAFDECRSVAPDADIKPKRPAFGDDLQIGSIVYFDPKRTIEGYRKETDTRGYRRGLVYGLWREESGRIINIEVMDFTTNISKVYTSDLLILTAERQKDLFSSKPTKLLTTNIHLVSNKAALFGANKGIKVIDGSLFPEILARRAHAILYSAACITTRPPKDTSHLIREGFCFEKIDNQNIRPEYWYPDVPSDKFKRIPSSILSQALVNDIAEFANSYHLRKAKLGEKTIYPTFEHWPVSLEETPIAPFPVRLPDMP